MEQKTIQVCVVGRVQGVFFRDYTRRKAEELNLVGWVKNCSDGNVESLISGSPASVKKMVDWFHQGSPHSRVREVLIHETKPDTDLTTFIIT